MAKANFVKVATIDELPPGKGKLVMAQIEKPIALFNVNGEFYAINYICPHMGGPLGEGELKGYVVTCPWHGWTFDVRTGLPDHPGGHSVSAYNVRVEGNDVLVGWLKKVKD
ncbi:Rieske 2Fe-2S domain-containing protein [Desulfobacterota bacterium AH_259_B03_O07]|nr:Rieske 2Fe-2S domain-containing protein [Desulfobacterota bacterium AH_259_B03_O07]